MAFNYKGLKEQISKVFEGVTDTNKLTELGTILGQVDEAEKEHDEMVKSQEELRTKYIASVKGASFKGEPKDDKQPEQKEFEDFLREEFIKEHSE